MGGGGLPTAEPVRADGVGRGLKLNLKPGLSYLVVAWVNGVVFTVPCVWGLEVAVAWVWGVKLPLACDGAFEP